MCYRVKNEREQGRGNWCVWAIFNSIVRVDFTEKVTFAARSEAGKQ